LVGRNGCKGLELTYRGNGCSGDSIDSGGGRRRDSMVYDEHAYEVGTHE